MADTPTVAKGSSETDIDKANQWIRSQPWYQEFIKSIGQDPSYVHLNDQQKRQLGTVIQAHGLPFPDNDEIDPAGNINPKGHKLRNFLIGAAIGGAAIAAPYIIPALSGAGAAGGGAAAGAGAGGVGLGETAAVTGLAGSGFGAGTAAGLGGAAAGLGGAGVGLGETGAVTGLAGSGLAGELGGLGATTVTGAGVGMPIVQGAESGGILSGLGSVKGITDAAGKLSPILGGINANRASNQQANDLLTMRQKQYELDAPATRLSTSRKASLLANFQPVKADWGGPGSGLAGKTVNFTGGFNNPDLYSPETKQLAQDIMHKQLLASLQGEDTLPPAGRSSTMDKILGGIGTGASILGAFGGRS